MSDSTGPAAAPRPMTFEEFLALPEDDGVERELIRGELRERPRTWRGADHSGVEATLARLLGNWMERQPRPRGRVHSGEAAFRLRREPATIVGIDVAVASADQVATTAPSQWFYDGPPLLAIEILSPSDTQERMVEKVWLYLEGVRV